MDLYQACEQCEGRFIPARSTARFCSARCRKAANRQKHRTEHAVSGHSGLPAALTSRHRWVRAKGKVPFQTNGRNASSTKPATWSSYEDVVASRVGDGFGIMLGAGLGCVDLDGCIDDHGNVSEFASQVIADIAEPIIFIERSMSGRGLHVFIAADEGPGVTRSGYERYTRQRFIRVTGERQTWPAQIRGHAGKSSVASAKCSAS